MSITTEMEQKIGAKPILKVRIKPVGSFMSGQYQTAVVYGGQIYVSSDYGATWTAKESNRGWYDISISMSGQYQTAVAATGYIYISADYGATWTAKATSLNWYGVSVSSTGQYQSAVGNYDYIYISTDYGATWTQKATSLRWNKISVSSTGQYQSAVVVNGKIYISSNYGTTWTVKDSDRNWWGISVSSTGQYQSATVYGGQIYVSADYGATWTAKDSARNWKSISISLSGQYQTAVVSTGYIYISADYGATWTQKATSLNWNGVSVSSTGQYQTAVVYGGQIYISADYGATWTAKASSLNWYGVSVSHGDYDSFDVTSYLKSCGTLDMEKSRTGEEALVSAGDMMFVFSNYNDKFTENDNTSIFNNLIYIGQTIDIDFGFRKDDGTIEYEDQAVFKITEVYLNSETSDCYIVGRDNINRLNKFILNTPSSALVAVAGSNTGNGYMSEIQAKPFSTVSENWTITCTLGGGSGVATFSVVGSTSGNIGTATSDTEFTTGSKVKFTIYAGGTNWVIGDSFTFTTRQLIEFTSLNPAKIIWSILTGHNYDTNTAEAWHDATPKLDNTKTAANTDINFPSFTTAISNLGTTFNLTGYIGINQNCSTVISDILLHFLGAIYTDPTGKIYLKTYTPSFGAASPREFSSSKKVTALQYKKDFDSIINSCTAKYKKTSSWAWSGEEETMNGTYTQTNSASITIYGEQTYTIETTWISVNNTAIQWAVDRIVDRYANPALTIDFSTGADALQTVLGDYIQVTDDKTQISKQIMEVFKLSKDFSAKPTKININCADTNTTGWNWGYCGSSANETDHDWTPAASQNFNTADNFEKQFCFASQTNGEGVSPDFYLW